MALKNNNNIGNTIGNDGAMKVCEMLKVNTTLTSLDLSSN